MQLNCKIVLHLQYVQGFLLVHSAIRTTITISLIIVFNPVKAVVHVSTLSFGIDRLPRTKHVLFAQGYNTSLSP